MAGKVSERVCQMIREGVEKGYPRSRILALTGISSTQLNSQLKAMGLKVAPEPTPGLYRVYRILQGGKRK
jgi:hypothetical protein